MSTNSDNSQAQLVEIAKAVGPILGGPLAIFAIVNGIVAQPITALIVALITAVLGSVLVVYYGWSGITQMIVAWLALIVLVLAGFVIWPRTMIVEGIISDTAGNPLSNEEVVLIDVFGVIHQTETDTVGYYQFKNVPTGTYKLRVRESEAGGGAGGILVRRVKTNLKVPDAVVVTSLTPTPSETRSPTLTPPPTPIDTPTPTATNTPLPPPIDTPTPMPTEPLATDTPPSTGIPTPTPPSATPPAGALPPLHASATVVNAIRTDQPPTIEGRLDEAVWSQAQPLTYAVHPPANDSTAITVRLLWDDKYLYAGFDVSDTQVEDSSLDNVWDGDSVGVIIENGGEVQEYRYTMLGDEKERGLLIGDRAGTTNSQAILKGATTLNNPDDQDEGYTVEMRIPWEIPPTAGSMIDADLWSIDHDYNPGKRYDDPDTVHFGISWDGDRNLTTARNSILLSLTPNPTPSPSADTPAPTDSGDAEVITRPDWCIPFSRSLASNTTLAGQVHASLEDCAEINYGDTLIGTFSNTPEGTHIWVLLYQSNGRYYPQSDIPSVGAVIEPFNGNWSVTLYPGTAESGPGKFDIVVVLANSAASDFFSDTLQNWYATNNYPGLSHDELPNGIMEAQHITVMRVEERTQDGTSHLVTFTSGVNQETGRQEIRIGRLTAGRYTLILHNVSPQYSEHWIIWDYLALKSGQDLVWEIGNSETPDDFSPTAYDEFCNPQTRNDCNTEFTVGATSVGDFVKELNDGIFPTEKVHFEITEQQAQADLTLILSTLDSTHQGAENFPLEANLVSTNPE